MMGSQLISIYWRDIPAQVNAQKGRKRAQAPLSPRSNALSTGPRWWRD